MKTAILVIVAIVAAGGINSLLNKRDAQLMRTAELYEQCVQKEYGMTPIAYYDENKKYPVCGN